jgi:hypothetical protein
MLAFNTTLTQLIAQEDFRTNGVFMVDGLRLFLSISHEQLMKQKSLRYNTKTTPITCTVKRHYNGLIGGTGCLLLPVSAITN